MPSALCFCTADPVPIQSNYVLVTILSILLRKFSFWAGSVILPVVRLYLVSLMEPCRNCKSLLNLF
jgi:hypothetical protein